MKIYISAPVMHDDDYVAIRRLEQIHIILAKHGFDYFSPQGYPSLEGRTEESKRLYNQNIAEMIKSNIFLAVGDDTETIYEAGYFRALADHFRYKTGAAEHKRYLITLSDDKLENVVIRESVDAHLVGLADLEKFTAFAARSWDKPDGLQLTGFDWDDHITRRKIILDYFPPAGDSYA
jgi:nucleoside 2-deoxyribosyltransferase|tara:strand:- start:998 stop:1531 length:534 start_codon:yes stop_codon:yes gene_type:complete